MKKKSLLIVILAASSLMMTSCGKTATGSSITRIVAIERLAGINANVTVHDFGLPNSVTINITNKVTSKTDLQPVAFLYDSNSHYYYTKSSIADVSDSTETSSGDSSSQYSESWEYIINQLTLLRATNNKGAKSYSLETFEDYAHVTSAWKSDTDGTLDSIYDLATKTSGSFLELLDDLNVGSYSGKETYASTGEGNLSLTVADLSNQSATPITDFEGKDTVSAKFSSNLPTYISTIDVGEKTETDKTITWNKCDASYPSLNDYEVSSSSSSAQA